MKATIKLYQNDGERNGLYPIKLILFNKSTRRKTIGHSSLQDWNLRNETPRTTHPNYDDLYLEVLEYRKKASKRDFMILEDFNKAFDYILKPVEKYSFNIDFYRYAQKRIDYMIKVGRTGNAEHYQTAINELKKFRSELRYNDINRSLITKFIDHKKADMDGNGNRNVQNSSIRVYIAELRAIYNRCSIEYDLPDNKPFKGVLMDLPVKKRRAANVYITYDTLRILRDTPIEHKSYQRAIDLFLIQFYLGGQSLVDIYYLSWNQIHNDRVFFERTKLGDRKEEFDVKLFDCAKELINKYSDTKKGYVFPWGKSRVNYKTFRDNHRRNLNIAFEKLNLETMPKNEKPNSKTPRHTFQTLGKFKMIDPDIIRELVGHERNDIDTVYKDKFPESVRDSAHLDIISF